MTLRNYVATATTEFGAKLIACMINETSSTRHRVARVNGTWVAATTKELGFLRRKGCKVTS